MPIRVETTTSSRCRPILPLRTPRLAGPRPAGSPEAGGETRALRFDARAPRPGRRGGGAVATVRASELRLLDVINIIDGRRLGNVCDIDLDVESGAIRALVLAGETGFFAFLRRRPDIEVPWHKIVKIGVDAILIELPETEGTFVR